MADVDERAAQPPPRWTRRRLLATATAGGAAVVGGAAAVRAIRGGNGAPGARGADPIVVVGAGLAGLAAADALHRAGVAAVVVEARDRIGGRVHTVRDWPGVPLDLGASWLHGVDANPLAPLARAAGARLVRTSYASGAVHVDPRLAAAGLEEPDTARWEGLVERALERARGGARDVPLAEAVAAVADPLALDAAERADLAFHLNATYVTEWGADPQELSAWRADDGEDAGPAGEDALLPDGLDRVVAHLGRGLEVRTGVAVRAIRLRGDRVEVETTAGRLRAGAAIVTAPLAVLAAGAIAFEPGLPAAVEHALGALRTGVLAKTFLRFERPFWPVDVDWQELVGPDAGRFAEWVSLARAGAPVLLAFNGGEAGRAVEAAPPREVQAEAMGALRAMLGPGVPAPVAIRTSAWSRDPLARGSYSYPAVGATRADRAALAEPIERRLILAGEATDPEHHSTLHGAHRSGLRAARQALAALA